LILETLIVEGGQETIFMPPGRLRKNAECLVPSVQFCNDLVVATLRIHGYCLRHAIPQPASRNKRSTEWMRFESLADFLDPVDGVEDD